MTIQEMIVDSAARQGVPANLALGVAAHESGFNPNATNHNSNGTTDWGVMQLNDLTVRTLGVANPLDPQQNIDAGVGLLGSLLQRYGGDSRQALWAYASGPGNVGPDKTPNSIAAAFIAFVQSYAGGIPSVPDSADSGDASYSDAGSVDWTLMLGWGLAGLAVWAIFFRD